MAGGPGIMHRVLGNRARPVTALVAAAVLVAIGWRYAEFSANAKVGFQYCSEVPEDCRDKPILLSLWRVVELRDDGYALFKVRGPVPVLGDPSGLAVGDTVSVVARFDADRGAVVEEQREVHHLRNAKRALSITGLLMVGLLLPLGFRWREGWVPRG